MTWNRVSSIAENGIITQYEIEFNQNTFDEVSINNVTTVNSSAFEVILSGLKEYVEYSIRVRAYTSEGPGPYSAVIYEITLQDREFCMIKTYLALTYNHLQVQVNLHPM